MKRDQKDVSSWTTVLIGSIFGLAFIGFGIQMIHATLAFDERVIQHAIGGTGQGILHAAGVIGAGLGCLFFAWRSFPLKCNRTRTPSKARDAKG